MDLNTLLFEFFLLVVSLVAFASTLSWLTMVLVFFMSPLAKFQTVRVGQLCGTSIFYIRSTVFLTKVTFFSSF